MSELKRRAEAALDQILRYGDEPYSLEIVELLEDISDLNDDMANCRHPKVIKEKLDHLRTTLNKIENTYEG